jgi:predicted SprT family Zn-dependent metalloprotease
MITIFQNFLLEKHNLKNEIDLQKEFDKYNKELFNGELKPITLKWENNKNSGARVISRLDKSTGKYNVEYLGVSEYFDYDYEIFKNIFIHELIHVYIIQNNIQEYGGHHGLFFRKIMNEINKKGYNVQIEMDSTDMMLSNQNLLTKPLCVVLIQDKNNKKSIVVWDMKLFTDGTKEKFLGWMQNFAKYKHDEFTIKFIESRNPNLNRYTVKRKMNRILYYGLSENLEKELQNDKVLEEIVLK